MGKRGKQPPNRIAEMRKRFKPKMTQERLAEKVGASVQAIIKLERGERKLTQTWMERLAVPLNCGPADLLPSPLGIDVSLTRTVYVVGEVQAGVFKEAIEWPPAEHQRIEVPVPEGYAGVRTFAVRVVGPSMNLKFPEGSVAICVSFLELRRGYTPEPGRFYVVHRKRGDEIEATIKRYEIDKDGVQWLWPMSSHPEYQQPWKIDGPEGEEVSIGALVIAKYEPI